MDTAVYAIEGGDYENGGSASRQLKEILKRIGVAPGTIRRAMVAAYEAEMNAVIHSHGGSMRVAVDPTQLDVVVEDKGPGIPDIEQAMREGFSTAPPKARELGFGAGMGLPNIRKSSDHFTLQSALGQGTQLRFRIFLTPQEAGGPSPNSVLIRPERCCQCLMCLRTCPTRAVRVREDRPWIADHLCIDCTSCISVCTPKALGLGGMDTLPALSEDTTLVLPSPFLEQFGSGCSPHDVIDALRSVGFYGVAFLDSWERELRAAVVQYARTEARVKPVLSPVCPAIVNLILLRYPSLVDHLAPFHTTIEAVREGIASPHVVFVAVCPAQSSALRVPGLMTRVDLVSAGVLHNAVASHLPKSSRLARSDAPPPVSEEGASEVFRVSGMEHVVRTLEGIENQSLEDYEVVELFACPQGCFGSPVWTEEPFAAYRRHQRNVSELPDGLRDSKALRRLHPLRPRAGIRLDNDMQRAIEKLGRINDLARRLPGRNCGVCGCPTCAALAEDIVMGHSSALACAYLTPAVRDELLALAAVGGRTA